MEPDTAGNRIQVGDLTLDLAVKRVHRGRETIELPVLSFDLLAELARAAPASLSCDELIERVWNGAVVNEETVTQRVRLLRKALDDDGRRPRYVASDRGRGYRLAALPQPVPTSTARPSGWRWPAFTAVALVAAVLTGIFLIQSGTPRSNPPALAEPGADELVARGWTYFDRHRAQDNEIALRLFRNALAQDPDNVKAMAGTSMVHAQRAMKFNYPVSEAVEAERIARRALVTDPGSFEARMALATALDAAGRVPDAIQAYESALALHPDHPGVLSSVAYLYHVSGALARGLHYALRARDADPDLPYVDLQIGQALRILGFEAAGEAYLVRADMLRPDNVFAAPERARFLLATGRFREAESVVTDAAARGVIRPELHEVRGVLALMRDDPATARSAFLAALALDGEAGQATTGLILTQKRLGQSSVEAYRQRVSGLEAAWADGDRWPWSMFELVQLHTAFGDLEAAERALSRFVDAGFRDTALLLAWPGLESLRHRPYFQAITQRINEAVREERRRFLAADWRPAGLISPEPSAARATRSP